VSEGEKRWYRTDKHPWRSSTGEVIAILVVCQPIASDGARLGQEEGLLANAKVVPSQREQVLVAEPSGTPRSVA